MDRQHIQWAEQAFQASPYLKRKWEKYFDVRRPWNFRVFCRKTPPNFGSCILHLRIPPNEFPELLAELGLQISAPELALREPWVYNFQEHPDPSNLYPFLDIELPREKTLEPQELAEILSRLGSTPFCILCKSSTGLATGRFHVVYLKKMNWGSAQAFVRRIIASLSNGDASAKILAEGIDRAPLDRGIPALRCPGSFGIYPRKDPQFLAYRPVGCWAPGGYRRWDRLSEDEQLTFNYGFLSPVELLPIQNSDRFFAIELGDERIPIPQFDRDSIMPFNYEDRSYFEMDEICKIVKRNLDDFGKNPVTKLTYKEWNTIRKQVVAYMNKYFALVENDNAVYRKVHADHANPFSQPGQTELLERHVFHRDTISNFHKTFTYCNSDLYPPDKKKACTVQWTQVWMMSKNVHRYHNSFGYSQPIVNQGGAKVFNLWTGSITQREALQAVKSDPVAAIEAVEFFRRFLVEVVCGDPFETPTYKKFAYGIFCHFYAFLVQCPHVQFPYAIYNWSPEQGVGKGLASAVATALVGMKNTFTTTGVHGLSGNYNGYVMEKLLVVADEEPDPKNAKNASSFLKHAATDRIVSGDKKYEGYKDSVNSLKFMFSSNLLNPLSLSDRRTFSNMMSSIYRNNTEYFNRFVTLCQQGNGPKYLAAWLYGMHLDPQVKQGLRIVKGQVRVRQDSSNDRQSLDPFQSVVSAWMVTRTKKKTDFKIALGESYFQTVAVEFDYTRFKIDPFPGALDLKHLWTLIVDRWFETDGWSNPSDQYPHHNQVLLMGTAISTKILLERIKAVDPRYQPQRLRESVGSLFGEQRQDIYPVANSRISISCLVGPEWEPPMCRTLWKFAKELCRRIWKRVSRLVEAQTQVSEGVWPISPDQLNAFLRHGIEAHQVDNTLVFTQAGMVSAYGPREIEQVVMWPRAKDIQNHYFDQKGGSRTPDSEIPQLNFNDMWHINGFPNLRGFRTQEEMTTWLQGQEDLADMQDLLPESESSGSDDQSSFNSSLE